MNENEFLDRLVKAEHDDMRADSNDQMQTLMIEMAAMRNRSSVTCAIRSRDFIFGMLDAALDVIAKDRGFPIETPAPYSGPMEFSAGETLSVEDLNTAFDTFPEKA